MNIIFIGFRGTGKTTIGKAIAKKINRRFIDTDELIVQKAKMSIPEIFTELGENGFRQLEKDVIRSLNGSHSVISCGGGAIIDPQNAQRLKHNGYCIWLKASADKIIERIQDDPNRPALTALSPEEEIKQLLEIRNPLYKKYTDIAFFTDNTSINKLLEEVIEHLEHKVL